MSKTNLSIPVFSDPHRLEKIQKILPKIDAIYAEYAVGSKIPGYCYGVVVDGRLIHTGYGGYANVDKQTAVTPKTVFRIASLSKSFTAMAILKLRDAGKLRLDDPIALYLPEIGEQRLTADSPKITIRDLLIHAGGFPQDDPWGDRKLHNTIEEFLALIKAGVNFSNATGNKFEYSNLGYTILGYIVNKVSGMPFQKYIAENIWQPLGMHSASWDYTAVPAQDLAHGYRWENDRWEEEPILADGIFASMGGIMISVEDFAKYIALHQSAWPARDDIDNGPVSRGTLRSMHQPWMFDLLNTDYKLIDGTALGFTKGYSYGLAWLQDTQAKTYVFHPGSLPGFHAHWMMLPEYGIAVVVMGNIKNAPRFDVNMQALNSIVKEANLQPRTLPTTELLLQRQEQLMQVLPDWQNATNSDIFAPNFFLDNSLEKWRKQTQILFAKAGNILRTSDFVPENQLRGQFTLEGEKAKLKVKFTLAPEKPSLIQELVIE